MNYSDDSDNELLVFDEASLEIVLPAKKEVFIQEYLIDLNASQAALRAGYSPLNGTHLLREPVVASRIRMAQAQRTARTQLTQDSVLHEMSLLANSRLDWFLITEEGDVILSDKAPQGAMGAVASIKKKTTVYPPKGDNQGYTVHDVEIKLWDKPGALKLMGKHVGLFADKVEHGGMGGGPIEHRITQVERVIVDPKDYDGA